MNGRRARAAGFTLVELLVALLVFAVLAAMAYSGLNDTLRMQELTEAHADRLARIQLVYRTLERDLAQVVDRRVRNEYGDTALQVIGSGSLENIVEFTRGGWRNPTGRLRSSLERVSYGVEDGTLVRRRWAGLDRAQNAEATKWELLPEVESIAVRFLDDKQVWRDTWLFERAEESVLPVAIEVILETEEWGRLNWLFGVTV